MVAQKSALVSAYVEACNGRTLFALSHSSGQPSRLSFVNHNQTATGQIAAFVFLRRHHAELVNARVRSDLEAVGALRNEGWFDIPGTELRDTVVNAAASIGASWLTAEQHQAEAIAAVDRVLEQVEEARKTGGLARVNAEYKTYRQRQLNAGLKARTYSQHLAEFARSLVVIAASRAESNRR